MVPGALGLVYSLVGKAPGDGKKIVSPRRRIPQMYLLSLLRKKIEDINLIGLSRRGDQTSLLIECGCTKQTQRRVWLAGPALRF